MGLFRQAAVDARKRVVIGNHLIPPSRHLTCLVWLCCGVFVLLTTWVLTRQYEQTKAIQGVTHYTQGEFSIISPHQGIVSDIHVTNNQSVVKGQALFTVNMQPTSGFTPADIQLQQTQYNTIQTHLLNKQKNIDVTFIAEKKYLQQSADNTRRVMNNLNEQLVLLNADHLAQQAQGQRMISLLNKGIVSHHQVEQHQVEFRGIKSRILQTEQSLIERGSQLALFNQQLVDLVSERDEKLANIEGRLVENNTKLQALKFQISAMITAPKDGVITQLVLNEGATIFNQQKLAVIVPEHGELVGRLVIPSIAKSDINIHQLVHLQMKSYPHKIYGQLQSTITSIDKPSFQTQPNGMHAQVALPEVWKTNKSAQEIILTSGMEFTALIVIEQYPLWQKIWLKLNRTFADRG